jgi:hypothetical protein
VHQDASANPPCVPALVPQDDSATPSYLSSSLQMATLLEPGFHSNADIEQPYFFAAPNDMQLPYDCDHVEIDEFASMMGSTNSSFDGSSVASALPVEQLRASSVPVAAIEADLVQPPSLSTESMHLERLYDVDAISDGSNRFIGQLQRSRLSASPVRYRANLSPGSIRAFSPASSPYSPSSRIRARVYANKAAASPHKPASLQFLQEE